MAHLPEEICLDTVTLMTWIRVDLAQQIIAGRISDGCQFFVESVVVDESTRRLGPLGVALVDAVLGLGVAAVQLESDSPEDWVLAASLARRMTDAQVAGGKMTSPPRSANFGEAASIVFIQTQRPGAMFVTSDRDAERIASKAGVLVARTSSFFAIEVELQLLTYEELWAAVCDTRQCSEDSAKCKVHGECPNLTDDAVDRGVLGHVARTQPDLHRTAERDLRDMQLLLEAK